MIASTPTAVFPATALSIGARPVKITTNMRSVVRVAFLSLSLACSAEAPASIIFSTGIPTNAMATASRPDVGGKTEIEAADDFTLASSTDIASATFTGVITSTGALSTIGEVVVEIYRVFPLDSTNPPDGTVPTRVNSPSDVAFDSRDSVHNLTFATQTVAATFTASNSVLNGINRSLTPQTGGEGAVTGREIEFTTTFTTPLILPAGHYFFVPQVQVTGGEFYWLSAARPIVPPGTPFAPDLQEWIRNSALDPDWLRVGTDIVGGNPAPTFNASFSLSVNDAGTSVPEPATLALLGIGVAGLAASRRRRLN